MANYVVSDTNLTAVANAIRSKTGGSASLEFPDDFVSEIGNISGGSSVDVEALNVTENGTYTAPSGKAYSPVTVTVSGGGTDTLTGRFDGTLKTWTSNITEIVTYGLYRCTSIETIILPRLATANSYCFSSCDALSLADFGTLSAIATYMFRNDPALKTLIIRKTDDICTLANTNAFNNTPFLTAEGGTLYVPEDLITSYQSASNWSTILSRSANQIKKIEGSIYE